MGRSGPMVNGSVCCFHGSVCYLMAQSAAFMTQAAEVPWPGLTFGLQDR